MVNIEDFSGLYSCSTYDVMGSVRSRLRAEVNFIMSE